MALTITAFAQSPDRGRGFARDMRVRWTLAELGLDYNVRLLSFAQLRTPEYLCDHPFGQIPTLDHDGLVLFESGAIVLHLAQSYPGLLPDAPDQRAMAQAWMFAALNTIEPVVNERGMALILERDSPWFSERQAMLDDRVRARLQQLSARLGQNDWLTPDFSAGDLLMVTVLRRLTGSDLLAAHDNLTAYVTRGEARPAFQSAFAAQRAVFEQTTAAS